MSHEVEKGSLPASIGATLAVIGMLSILYGPLLAG